MCQTGGRVWEVGTVNDQWNRCKEENKIKEHPEVCHTREYEHCRSACARWDAANLMNYYDDALSLTPQEDKNFTSWQKNIKMLNIPTLNLMFAYLPIILTLTVCKILLSLPWYWWLLLTITIAFIVDKKLNLINGITTNSCEKLLLHGAVDNAVRGENGKGTNRLGVWECEHLSFDVQTFNYRKEKHVH